MLHTFKPHKLRGYWTKAHQILSDVEEPLPLNLLALTLKSSNLFWNANAMNEDGIYTPI